MSFLKAAERAVAFFSLYLLASLFLFVQGNFRFFSDDNLLSILHFSSVLAVLLIFTALIFAALAVYRAFRCKEKVFPRILLVIPALLFAFFSLYASQFVTVLATFSVL